MFHISSPYFLHLFFRFSLNCPNVKNSNCFHHRSTDVCKHTGTGKTFYYNEFFLCKNLWISCTASASTDPRLRLSGTQTHLFSVATKVYCAKCFWKMIGTGSWDKNLQPASQPKTEPLPRRNELFQHGGRCSETSHCEGWYAVPWTTGSIKEAQQNSQGISTLLRVRLAGKKIAVAVRPE